MDMQRAILAIVLSFLIIIGYQYFFLKPAVHQPAEQKQTQNIVVPEGDKVTQSKDRNEIAQSSPEQKYVTPTSQASAQIVAVDETAKDITVDTPLYNAVFNEQGGGLISFVLKNYKQENIETSSPVQLVMTNNLLERPLLFTLDNGLTSVLPVYKSDHEKVVLKEGESSFTLTMTATLTNGIRIVRKLIFDPASYLIKANYLVENTSNSPIQITPAISLFNRPFSEKGSDIRVSRFMFSGPVALQNGQLTEVKTKDLAEGVKTYQGNINWTAYEDNYFICALIPQSSGNHTVTMSGIEGKVRTDLSSELVQLGTGMTQDYSYVIYFGPKKLTILKHAGFNLSKAVNFGWFDVIAKPMLGLLNFFYAYIGNYGVAIILLTILIKLAFWPIAQKGMKSMKNMQKLQPKVAKLKEKFKNDPQKMNQEMMALYKSYKVNPLGGCLPMFLQIPFFFALYKVLFLAIELRHAPFMLWINDLSAPDRLWIGFDIPMLHGIPVLTLLMGASMYLQQKMTPTTADPTQAKIMQFLPVIFTFMFLNFASGLVLYWFINNLLSILQQQLINRQVKA